MNKTTKTIVGLVIIGLVFFGGYKYGQSQKGSGGRNLSSMQGAGGLARRSLGGGGGMTAGEILSKDSTSITLKLRDGGSKIILVSTSTDVQKMAKGSLDDLAVGASVSVTGGANADGSLTAQSVQLRPNLPQGQGKPAGN